jgi:His-Xaa-Ser system protein HxsD
MSKSVLVIYESCIYSADVIQKAAYKGLNYFTLDLEISGDKFLCKLNSNIQASEEAFNHAVEEFKKDILDFQLREKIKIETEPLRNLVLAIAFSNTDL